MSHTGILKDGNERIKSLDPVQGIRVVSRLLMAELLPSGSSHVITARSNGVCQRGLDSELRRFSGAEPLYALPHFDASRISIPCNTATSNIISRFRSRSLDVLQKIPSY